MKSSVVFQTSESHSSLCHYITDYQDIKLHKTIDQLLETQNILLKTKII